jgi:hypothetical protein
VIIILLFCFSSASSHLWVFELLWFFQVGHLMVKFIVLWKPIYIDASKPFEVIRPRSTFQAENLSFLSTLAFMEIIFVVNGFDGDWVWSLLAIVTVVLIFYTGGMKQVKSDRRP